MFVKYHPGIIPWIKSKFAQQRRCRAARSRKLGYTSKFRIILIYIEVKIYYFCFIFFKHLYISASRSFIPRNKVKIEIIISYHISIECNNTDSRVSFSARLLRFLHPTGKSLKSLHRHFWQANSVNIRPSGKSCAVLKTI